MLGSCRMEARRLAVSVADDNESGGGGSLKPGPCGRLGVGLVKSIALWTYCVVRGVRVSEFPQLLHFESGVDNTTASLNRSRWWSWFQ